MRGFLVGLTTGNAGVGICSAKSYTDQGGPMFKPRFVLTALGMIVALVGTAGGYLLPVGLYCSGAFGLQKASKEEPDVMRAVAALTTCHTNAKQYAPIWTSVIVAGLILFTVGLVWMLVVRGRQVPRRNGSETAAEQPLATRRPDRARSGPIWPLLLGLAIIGVGTFLGYTVSVGPHCDGAFTQQTSAAGADIASAMNGKLSNYSEDCRAASGQQSVIYWGIIGFGGAVVVLGLVLQTVLGRPTSIGSKRDTVADELEQLARLLEQGVLTQDEFARQKEKLLSRG